MTRAQLIEVLAQRGKLTRSRAEDVVKCVFDAMTRSLTGAAKAEDAADERAGGIEIRGFGTFTVRSYRPYKGRNPKTRESVEVSAKPSG